MEVELIAAFLGFTFLVAAFFPLGPQIAQLLGTGMYVGAFKGLPPIVFHAFMLVLTYLPAALVTAWFFKTSRLASRLPTPIPGKGFLAAGVTLTLLFLAPRLFASTIEGGGPSFVVAQFGPLVLWPARVLLAVGVVKMLIAAQPNRPSSSNARCDA